MALLLCVFRFKVLKINYEYFWFESKNSTVIIIHSIIIIAIPIYVLVVSRNFLAFLKCFRSFGYWISCLVCNFHCWLCNIEKNIGYEKLVCDPQYNSLNIKTVMVWSIAVIVGALINIFTSSSFDIIVTFMVSGFLYYIFNISLNTHRKKAKNEKFIKRISPD